MKIKFSSNSYLNHGFACGLHPFHKLKYSLLKCFSQDTNRRIVIPCEGSGLPFYFSPNKSFSTLFKFQIIVDFDTSTIEISFRRKINFLRNSIGLILLPFLFDFVAKEYPGTKVETTIRIPSAIEFKIFLRRLRAYKLQLNRQLDSSLRITVESKTLANGTKLSRIPSLLLSSHKIGVVANDAGGAEQITWVLRMLNKKVIAFLKGPAKTKFEKSGVKFEAANNIDDLKDCDLIITGTGWMTNHERDGVKFARKNKIVSVSVLDHWENYRSRFESEDRNLPNALIVTNPLALEISRVQFPKKIIWLIPDEQVLKFRSILSNERNDPGEILVISEPTSAENSLSQVNVEHLILVLDFAIKMRSEKKVSNIVVRQHPSLTDKTILDLVARKYKEDIAFSDKTNIIEDFNRAAVVVGMGSHALYLSSECDLETYSLFKQSKEHWTNHFKKIKPFPIINT